MRLRKESGERALMTLSVSPAAVMAESGSANTVYPLVESMLAGRPARAKARLNSFKRLVSARDCTICFPVKGIGCESRMGESDDFRQALNARGRIPGRRRPISLTGNEFIFIMIVSYG